MPIPTEALAQQPHNPRTVLHALALYWQPCTRTTLVSLLAKLGWKDDDGRRFDMNTLLGELKLLSDQGWVEEIPNRANYWQLDVEVMTAAYLDMLDSTPASHLQQALLEMHNLEETGLRRWAPYFSSVEIAVSVLRLALHSGASPQQMQHFEPWCRSSEYWETLLQHAALDDFDPELFVRLHPQLQAHMATLALIRLQLAWDGRYAEIPHIARQLLEQGHHSGPLPLALIEYSILSGQTQQVEDIIALVGTEQTASQPAWPGYVDCARAAVATTRGQWAAAQQGFEAGLAKLKKHSGRRKQLMHDTMAWLYPLALMAQQTPAHLELARKFCATEAGSRNPGTDTLWGVLCNAIRIRLGELPRNAHSFQLQSSHFYFHETDFWRIMVRVWLLEPGRLVSFSQAESEAIPLVHALLKDCGLVWMVEQLNAALTQSLNQPVEGAFFAAQRSESWRITLAALAALGNSTSVSETDTSTRLIWQIALSDAGEVKSITALEQKQGVRGWGKSKAIPLSRLAKDEKLPPEDLRVARAIRKAAGNNLYLDLANAVVALIGHPMVELADAPGQNVELVEAMPQLEVIEAAGELKVKVTPAMRPAPTLLNPYLTAAQEKEREALRLITVVRDSPSRAQVIRFTPEQLRAAQLVGKGLSLPAQARDELQQALSGLATHFQVAGNQIDAARETTAETRLRAELSPKDDGLILRLVAAPLGEAGPRLIPGIGRTQLIARIAGEALSATRDLKAENAQLDAVLAIAEMLNPLPRKSPQEWEIASPDDALTLLALLPESTAIAGIDWPRGKAIRVNTLQPSALKVSISSGRDWLALQGEARIDEQLVLSLNTLLEFAKGENRFVALGDGQYLTLTQELRTRLAELSAVADIHKGEARVPQLAAAWLDDALTGIEINSDQAFRERLQRLSAVNDSMPVLPSSLQAELRDYQHDGYQWIMRLAASGFGACLADDMGLGKTLQALAVLLARAGEGPALVIAPTSLTGNWQAEARRFAPTLNVSVYSEGDEAARSAMIADAQAGDVLLVSYTLLLQASDAFAARTWHTLVVDEAQAIKNAQTKRSQAVFQLDAGFRLALSGTPIENRLSELWAIMRYCNPGLLGSSKRFSERFANPIERENDRNAQRTLRRLISPFILRRTKQQVLDELPPRTELVLAVKPDAAELAHYESLRRQALQEAEQGMADGNAGQARMNMLAQLTKLRRAACDPRLVNPQLGLSGAKVQAFAELAEELVANRHKVLVFSQFVDFLALLREPLDAAGIAYQYLDGATPVAERNRRVAAFQAGEGELFLISLKAGGFGLNLTAADYVIIADPWWNPAAEDQAMGRAHRMGQQRPVTVYRLVNEGTLEQSIIALHHDKRALADGILEEGGGAIVPSGEDLLALIRG
ncbi:DEAD/DEAH box helicase [Craterilacuibacter sp.]|uniref:DEAD/DEAH box helicase n=1 Tax=Craterilacuibacter sp. TaxID=2870909 RepID=UPI003F2E5492